ncbi:MAG TPA: DNA-deoxyinosine glycosylase [Candidatus Faecousia intestinigallinarum]|nr:DNA-deoxyinosine glycosylase [Candidatus Faecousia intestinigallinarum]
MQERVHHPFSPIFDAHSKVLILGSFPSVKSRENAFYYGHPQNRFWKVLAQVLEQKMPVGIAEKERFLLKNRIALWDVIASCEIEGSADSSIRRAVPNPVENLLAQSEISQIFVNGAAAARLYDKYLLPRLGLPAVRLPSTSPANAAWSLPRLCAAWEIIRENCGEK